jgi:hypothetical protein
MRACIAAFDMDFGSFFLRILGFCFLGEGVLALGGDGSLLLLLSGGTVSQCSSWGVSCRGEVGIGETGGNSGSKRA